MDVTIKTQLDNLQGKEVEEILLRLQVTPNQTVDLYTRSINKVGDSYFFIFRKETERFLGILPEGPENATINQFQGAPLTGSDVRQCPLSAENAEQLRNLFDFTRPRLMGLETSYGLGDRLGLANPAHLRAIRPTGIKAILAQQSIRELERTQRTPQEVVDVASWAVFQEGYREGFGADADHLKTVDDIDVVVPAGFRMFTFDPGDHVVNEADFLPLDELRRMLDSLPWQALETDFELCLSQYADKKVRLSDQFILEPNASEVVRGLAKYGFVLAHVVEMHTHLEEHYSDIPIELELSVDETDAVTTPFEHYLVTSELKRLGIELTSLAPRFVGDFYKGIDFRGDIELFKAEYVKHLAIAETLGPYKMSIHSGSDKFSVYNAIGELDSGLVHVKTAGTSYLEALRAIAHVDTDFFREILDYSRDQYEEARASYHVVADLARVPAGSSLTDDECIELFESNDDARQVLHVNFGGVLTDKTENGNYLFRDRIHTVLKEHEEVHFDCLERHFKRHFAPFCQ
ncbi:MAG TPA: tagaturonate epimerase family protein [Acidobacteriota bacterium]|nr:tagaturonate epimerase family protein [Acidobacteriota bacterium]